MQGIGFHSLYRTHVIAAFLLLAAKGGAHQRAVGGGRIKRSGSNIGGRELLSHTEVSAAPGYASRDSRGLPNSRDQLLRRGSKVFWIDGMRSRAVKLSFN